MTVPTASADAVRDVTADYPHIRKVGRYLFFALCGFGVGVLAYALARSIGLSSDVAKSANTLSSIVAFFALRDMDKAARAAALRSHLLSQTTQDETHG